MKRAAALLAALNVVLAVRVASAAPLGDNTVRLAPSQLKLPQNIGPLRFSGQNRFSDRRLGRSFSFNASGISLSVYVYDYGIEGIPFLAIIAPDGTVRHIGLHPGDPAADVAGKIEAILREFKLPVPTKS